MKRFNLIILIVISLSLIKTISGQQAPTYTQYMFDDYMLNPGVVGTNNFFQVKVFSRNQWMRFTSEAPRTYGVSYYGPLKKKTMGYGAYIYNDVTGPESRAAFGGSYGYNIALNDVMRISGGLSFGFVQYKLAGSEIKMDPEIYDPSIPVGDETTFKPDASVGFYLYSSYYYAGISANQLFGTRYNSNKEVDTIQGLSRLTQHVYLTGGYNLFLNKDFAILPSALIKYSSPMQIQAELNATVYYQKMVWFGLTYRTLNEMAIMAGYNYENRIYLGLSYDISFSQYSKYLGGSIEVMISYRFNGIK